MSNRKNEHNYHQGACQSTWTQAAYEENKETNEDCAKKVQKNKNLGMGFRS